jgi:prepilin-type N-terminal cleavage/methylation domain-containing protein
MERFAFFNRFNCFNLPATKVRFLNRIRVSHPRTQSWQQEAFTLIELLVVIAIIAVLIGLLFPAFRAVQNQAKQTQAKNDLTQIVNAVNAYYTDYGKYPIAAPGSDVTFAANNNTLFDVLRNMTGTTPGNTLNPRAILFIQPPAAKDQNNPKSGIKTSTGVWYDPWGLPYNVAIDANYNNIVRAPNYTDLAATYVTATDGSGDVGVGTGVISWSLGSDGQQATIYKGSDDVISWQ